jgi:putative phosphoribosyl transferase
MRFPDRTRAGQLLAEKLDRYANIEGVVVVALPPGGVLVGYEIAIALNAPLEILVPRMLCCPQNPLLIMGAVSAEGTHVLYDEVIQWLKISDARIDAAIAIESAESQRLDKLYRGDTPHLGLSDKTVILVDDGVTSLASMRMTITLLRLRCAAHIVLVVPVATVSFVRGLRSAVDEVVTFFRVGVSEPVPDWYDDLGQVTDQFVRDLYERASSRLPNRMPRLLGQEAQLRISSSKSLPP